MASDQSDNRRKGFDRLAEIAGGLEEGATVHVVTVRELLRWFGAQRRDDRTVFDISTALEILGLRTEPWFEDQFIDGPLQFRKGYFGGTHIPSETDKLVRKLAEDFAQREAPKAGDRLTAGQVSYLNSFWLKLVKRRVEDWIEQHPGENLTRDQVQEKVDALAQRGLEQFSEEEIKRERYLMLVEKTEEQHALPLEGRATPPPSSMTLALPVPSRTTVTIPETTFQSLKSANNPPMSIAPNRKVTEAITRMLLRDFSQLPVMSGEREVKGIISFKSISECLTSGRDLDGEVREYMNTSAFEIRIDDPLLDVIGDIIRNGYALVRERGKIVGIVTDSDLSEQFRQLSEPFLVIKQIENHLRSLIQTRIPEDTLQRLNGADFEAPRREVKSVLDLVFGDYQRLLHDDKNWEKLRVRADKAVFHRELEKTRKIRNNVMHFDPDGITSEDLTVLQEFAKLLRTLEDRRG